MYRRETLDQHAKISLLLMPKEKREKKTHRLETNYHFNFKMHKYVKMKKTN